MRDESGNFTIDRPIASMALSDVDQLRGEIRYNLRPGVVGLKVKRLHPDAVIPSYAKPGDAGMDLTAINRSWDDLNKVWVYGTGLAFEIPIGHVGLIFPRSSIFKKDLALSNCVGVIDSGYRGEVKFMFKHLEVDGRPHSLYETGNRIGQLILMPFPQVEVQEVTELSTSERGEGSFGHTGA